MTPQELKDKMAARRETAKMVKEYWADVLPGLGDIPEPQLQGWINRFSVDTIIDGITEAIIIRSKAAHARWDKGKTDSGSKDLHAVAPVCIHLHSDCGFGCGCGCGCASASVSASARATESARESEGEHASRATAAPQPTLPRPEEKKKEQTKPETKTNPVGASSSSANQSKGNTGKPKTCKKCGDPLERSTNHACVMCIFCAEAPVRSKPSDYCSGCWAKREAGQKLQPMLDWDGKQWVRKGAKAAVAMVAGGTVDRPLGNVDEL
jgi:hypothetical protein